MNRRTDEKPSSGPSRDVPDDKLLMKYTSQTDIDALIAAVDAEEQKRTAAGPPETPKTEGSPGGTQEDQASNPPCVPEKIRDPEDIYAADLTSDIIRAESESAREHQESGTEPAAAPDDPVLRAADASPDRSGRIPDGADSGKTLPDAPRNDAGPEPGGTDADLPVSSQGKPFGKGRRILRTAGIAASAVCGVYLIGAAVFSGRFLPRTFINGVDYSGQTVSHAEAKYRASYAGRTVTLKSKTGAGETISLDAVGYTLTPSESFSDLQKAQNPWTWPYSLFHPEEIVTEEKISFSEDALRSELEKLSLFTSPDITGPTDAVIEKDSVSGSYVLTASTEGTLLNEDSVVSAIAGSLTADSSVTVDLAADDCYQHADTETDSPGIRQAYAAISAVQNQVITLNLDGWKIPLAKDTFLDWLSFDSEGNATVDDDAVRAYIDDLADQTDTFGKPRNFHSTSGELVSVGGGAYDTYGYKMNRAETAVALSNALKNGGSQTVDVLWIEEGATRATDNADIGYTYIEVSIDAQHMWYYVDGVLQLDTDITSGTLTSDRMTPVGAYKVLKKLTDYTMVTETYSSFVNFAIRVNYVGIYIHDAPWRSSYGGTVYKYAGSHGCINTPYNAEKTLFDAVPEGTPVLIY